MHLAARLLLFPALLLGAIVESGPVGPAGQEVACDLPADLRTKNVGGTDGSGLCVFTSIGHAARYQNERKLADFQRQMRAERGGGWPEKVDAMVAKYAPGAAYVQATNGDLAFLRKAIASGRMPSVTYAGRDPHYGRATIAHMVNLVHLDDTSACVLDNNFVGERQLLWMTPAEFAERWRANGGGWAVVLLAPAPPPAPRN